MMHTPSMRLNVGLKLTLAILGFVVQQGFASVTLVTSPAALAANDVIQWGQLGAPLSFPVLPANVTSTGGLGATLASSSTVRVFVQSTPNPWNGLFLNGDQVLHPYGLISIGFTNPVRGVGTNIHHDWLNLTATATLQAFDVNNLLLGTVTIETFFSSAVARGQGTAPFFGILSSERNIARITLESVAPVPPPDRFGNATKFAINDLRLLTTDVPEPSSFVMVAGFLVALIARRRS